MKHPQIMVAGSKAPNPPSSSSSLSELHRHCPEPSPVPRVSTEISPSGLLALSTLVSTSDFPSFPYFPQTQRIFRGPRISGPCLLASLSPTRSKSALAGEPSSSSCPEVGAILQLRNLGFFWNQLSGGGAPACSVFVSPERAGWGAWVLPDGLQGNSKD